MARHLSSKVLKLVKQHKGYNYDRYIITKRNNLFYTSIKLCHNHLSQNSPLIYTEDRYKGIHIDLDQISDVKKSHNNEIGNYMQGQIALWKESGITTVWLKIHIKQSEIIPELGNLGFRFHHAEGEYSMLFLWIGVSDGKSKLPQFATHQVGVSGCVLNPESREVLVVRDKNRPFTLWKFPGGLSELGEDIGTTAEREVYEETGVKSEFQGVLTFRQQHNQPGAFGRSDFYFICHMKPLSYDLNPCADEIEACQWMQIKELVNTSGNSAITLRVLQLINIGLEEGFQSVVLPGESFKSVYKGFEYKLYNRMLPEGSELTDYLYNIANYNDRKS